MAVDPHELDSNHARRDRQEWQRGPALQTRDEEPLQHTPAVGSVQMEGPRSGDTDGRFRETVAVGVFIQTSICKLRFVSRPSAGVAPVS